MPRLLAALALALLLVLPAAAAERITEFSAHLAVEADGLLTVTESIAVAVDNSEINHGIFRDIPTILDGPDGPRRSRLEIVSVRLDGRPEDWRDERKAEGVRLIIGSENRTISKGRHVYEITYRISHQVRFFESHDEIYWNVTGNGWHWTIDSARAVVELPNGVYATQVHAYTGPAGAKGQNWRVRNEDGRVSFTTTRPLGPAEGLTVAVGFPKGLIEPPPPGSDEPFVPVWVPTTAFGGLLVILGVYLIGWWRAGRDPAAGVVVPRFEPPSGVSAAAARTIMGMGYDDTVMATAIVSLAVKGALIIHQDKGLLGSSFTLERTDATPKTLTDDERAVLAALFSEGESGTLPVNKDSYSRFDSARDALKAILKKTVERDNFRRNTGTAAIGWSLSAILVLVLLSASPEAEDSVALGVIAGVTLGLVPPLILWAQRRWEPGRRFKPILALLAAFVLLVAGALALFMTVATPAPLTGFSVGLLGPLASLFKHLLKAPTVSGRKLMDQLEGFKLYLSVAERERLAVLHPPEETPALFERYLPYAMGLGVAHLWSERFASTMPAYAPAYWTGLHGDLGSFGSSIDSAFAGAVSGASTTTSGSGGGGSSGGGGGGGGGGGW